MNLAPGDRTRRDVYHAPGKWPIEPSEGILMSDPRSVRLWVRPARFIAILFCLLLLFGWQLEKKMIFVPFTSWSEPLPASAQEIKFSSADGTELSGAWFPSEEASAVLLQCHGNAGNISHRFEIASHWQEQGWSVLLFDYRGYGRSQGHPTEQGIIADARAAAATARRLSGKEVVAYGRSLGTVPAVVLAAEGSLVGLILDSPLLNGSAIADVVMPVPGLGMLMQTHLDNSGRIGSITCPLLLLHGDADELVPYDQGVELYRLAPQPKLLVKIPGGKHNDQRLRGIAFESVREFLSELTSE